MNRTFAAIIVILSFVLILGSSIGVSAGGPTEQPAPVLLASGLEGALGSTVGPGGYLYVTEGVAGRISRVDPQSGEITAFASGLPPRLDGVPIGGAHDVAFIGDTAYVMVTMVSSDLDPNSQSVDGIYRMDGPDTYTVIADLGQYTLDNPSKSDVFVLSGVLYAMDVYDGGFLVTDGHHNRVLQVSPDGAISEWIAFDNIVPTGLAVWGDSVYVSRLGHVPHPAEEGQILTFGPDSMSATEVASGARMPVDVEFGHDGNLYALSQGDFPDDGQEGSPAVENTGSLVRANADGTFTVIADGLNQPTSLEFIGNTAYIVTLGGEVWRIDGVY